jgi:hypothetical protein
MTKKNYGDNAEEPSLGNLGPVWLLKTKYRGKNNVFSTQTDPWHFNLVDFLHNTVHNRVVEAYSRKSNGLEDKRRSKIEEY